MTTPPAFMPRRTGYAMSNAKRQQRFRENHPGYYQRLHARRRAELKALAAAQAEAAACAVTVSAPSIPSLLDRVRAQPLMLPAPVEQLIFPAIRQREYAVLERSWGDRVTR